jgi:hypothetical protein
MYNTLLSGTSPLKRAELLKLFQVTTETLSDAINAFVFPRPSYWILATDGRWRRRDLLRWIDNGGYHSFKLWLEEKGHVCCAN